MSGSEIVMSLLGRNVVFNNGNGTGVGTSFFSYPMDVIYVLLFNVYVVLLPFLVFTHFKVLDSKKIFLTVLAGTSFSVLYFANYWHYYQYIIPFTLLLLIYIVQSVKQTKYNYLIVHSSLVLSVFFLVAYSVLSVVGSRTSLQDQQKAAKSINTIIPSASAVYLDGLSPVYYYLCGFTSIDLKDIGFSFSGYFAPKTILDHLDYGEYLVVNNDRLLMYEDQLIDYSITKITVKTSEYFLITKK
jgi:hypothetical protein